MHRRLHLVTGTVTGMLTVAVVAAVTALAASPAPVDAQPVGPGHLTSVTPPASGPLVDRLRGVHDATEVISVTTASYGSDHATVRAFRQTSRGWRQVHGPWSAWIGRDGFARPQAKREGDGKTPSGSYRFSFFFGVEKNPGAQFPWRHASPADYWDDDPASPHYNTWVDTAQRSAGRDPEPLHVQPSYDDVAVIAFNTGRVPGRGSAIFLHVTHHSATSGCVALPRRHVLTLLRWLDPADHPRIIMGRTATVTR